MDIPNSLFKKSGRESGTSDPLNFELMRYIATINCDSFNFPSLSTSDNSLFIIILIFRYHILDRSEDGRFDFANNFLA